MVEFNILHPLYIRTTTFWFFRKNSCCPNFHINIYAAYFVKIDFFFRKILVLSSFSQKVDVFQKLLSSLAKNVLPLYTIFRRTEISEYVWQNFPKINWVYFWSYFFWATFWSVDNFQVFLYLFCSLKTNSNYRITKMKFTFFDLSVLWV